MKVENTTKDAAERKPKRRLLKFSIVAIFLIVLLAVFFVPAFLSSKSGNKIILSQINQAGVGDVSFSSFSIGWFSGIKIDELNFIDPKGQTKVAVRKIITRPKYLSILMGNLLLGETIIDEPKIEVSVKETDTAKEKIPAKDLPADKTSKSPAIALAKIKVTINNGNLKVVSKSGKTVEISQINAKFDINGPGKQAGFDIDMQINDHAGKSKITAEGLVRLGISQGNLNWQKTDGNIKAAIDELDLESISALLDVAGIEFDASGKLNADVDVKINDGRFEKLNAKAVLSDFKRKVAGKDTAIDEPVKMDIAISSDNEDVRIDRLTVESSFCKIRCKGGVNSVDYNVTADLGGIQNFASQFADFKGFSMAGNIAAEGKLDFAKGSIKTAGQADLENVSIHSDATKEDAFISGQLPFDIEIDTTENLFRIDSLKLKTDSKNGPGEIEIKNSVVPLKKNTKEKLSLNITAMLDLQKTMPLASVFLSVPQGMKFTGKIKTNLSVKEKSEGYHIVADRTQLEEFSIAQPGKETFEEPLLTASIDMIYKDNNAVEVKRLQVDSSVMKITDGKFKKKSSNEITKIEGQLQCEYDWKAVSDMVSAFLPEGLSLEGSRKDIIKFSSQYPDTQPDNFMENLETHGKLGFQKAEYMGLNFGKTDVDIQIRNGLLEIAPFFTVVNNGKFNFAGHADFNQKPAIFQTPNQIKIIENININDQTTKKLLAYVNPVFAGAVNVRGIANFDCEKLSIPLASDSINDLEVVGTISITKMQLEASDLLAKILTAAGSSRSREDITIHPTKFTVQNGFLQYDDMQMDIGNRSINFKGIIGLADKSLDMKVLIPYKGEKKVAVPLKGTINKPELDLAGLLGETLQQQLEEELEEQLGEELKEKILEGLEGLFE